MKRIRLLWEPARWERILALTLVLAAFSVSLAYADYSGPQRTTTEEECESECVPTGVCYYRGTQVDSPNYSCVITAPCGGNPGRDQWSVNRCGWPSGHGEVDHVVMGEEICEEELVCRDVTVSLPAASLSASLDCPGDNGWCQSAPLLHFSGQEPLQGYQITQVESAAGGLCSINSPSGSCATQLDQGEGAHSLVAWALSSYGDSSLPASLAWQQDSQPPTLDYSLPAPDGENGWHRGPLSVSATGSDATSGLAAAEVAVDGVWQASPVSLNADGIYTVAFRSRDVAGHETSSGTYTVRIDSTPPTHSLQVQGALANGWYGSELVFDLSGQDSGSGLASQLIRLDGGDWQAPGAYTLGDGPHQLEYRSRDAAGNEVLGNLDFQVDSSPPQGQFTSGDVCIAGDYAFAGQVSDGQSGLDQVRLALAGQVHALGWDGAGHWEFVLDSLGLPDGSYRAELIASDRAGNQARVDQVQVEVDNQAPAISLPARWAWHEAAPLQIEEQGSGPGKLQVELWRGERLLGAFVFGPQQVPATIAWSQLIPQIGGSYPDVVAVRVEARDHCGNLAQAQAEIYIPAPRPSPLSDSQTSAPVEDSSGAEPAPLAPPAEPEPPPPTAPEPTIQLAPALFWLWPSPLLALLSLGLLLAFGLARDGRAAALHRLAATLHEHQEQAARYPAADRPVTRNQALDLEKTGD